MGTRTGKRSPRPVVKRTISVHGGRECSRGHKIVARGNLRGEAFLTDTVCRRAHATDRGLPDFCVQPSDLSSRGDTALFIAG